MTELKASLAGASETNPQRVIDWPLILNKAGLSLILVIVLILLFQQIDSVRLKRMPPQAAIRQIYRRLYHRSRSLTGQVAPSLTPNEFADLLQEHAQEASRADYLKNTLFPIASKARGLTKLYNQALYSLHTPSRPEIKTALQSWRDLRWRLWLARFKPPRKGGSSSISKHQ